MTFELIKSLLGWCAVLNMVILLWWFVFIAIAHDWTYRMHNRFFQISVEQFNATHYAAFANFKLAVFFFNIVPYLALRIVL